MKSQYKLPRSAFIDLARRLSVSQSLWYSARFRGRVLVGRGSRLHVHRKASVRLVPGATLVIGLAHDTRQGAVLRMRPRSVLRIDGRVQWMRGVSVEVGYDAVLSIGAGTFLNDGASVVCHESVSIGAGCAMSWGVRIVDTDVHVVKRPGKPAVRRSPVVIGDRCWIGADALVLKGSEHGDS